MNAIFSMINRMAGIGGVLFFFPSLFGFEAEIRMFFRRYWWATAPVLATIFVVGAVAIHAEIVNQERDYKNRLKGASFRPPKR